MDYDVFISYRRDGGDSLAMTIKNELRERGYRVFHDIESLRSGKFNKQLYDEIERSNKVVLILPPNALDRCINDPNDWVRLEIEHAIKCKKDIIPIMMRGFVFPDGLPSPLDQIKSFQGLEPRMDHTFDASMDYLVTLIDGDDGYRVHDKSFDMRQVRTFASCGNEDSVLKVKKSLDGCSVKLRANFEKTRLRNEFPEFAGAYYLKRPPIDLRGSKKITFKARSANQSMATIWVEIKPEGKKWMHESFEFDLSPEFETYSIDIADFQYRDTLHCVEEITFVIKQSSFANDYPLVGEFEIAELCIE